MLQVIHCPECGHDTIRIGEYYSYCDNCCHNRGAIELKIKKKTLNALLKEIDHDSLINIIDDMDKEYADEDTEAILECISERAATMLKEDIKINN